MFLLRKVLSQSPCEAHYKTENIITKNWEVSGGLPWQTGPVQYKISPHELRASVWTYLQTWSHQQHETLQSKSGDSVSAVCSASVSLNDSTIYQIAPIGEQLHHIFRHLGDLFFYSFFHWYSTVLYGKWKKEQQQITIFHWSF